MKIRCFRIILAGFVVCFSCSPVFSQSNSWSFSTGVDYSSGDYGGDPIETTIVYIPFNVSYSGELWQFSSSISHASIEGAGTVLPGEGTIRDSLDRAPNIDSSTESGVGDLWISLSRAIDIVPSELFYLDLSGKVKIPLADEDKGLGSGVSDYTLQADIFKPLGKAMPFVTVAYKVRGNSENYDLENVFAISVGSDFRLTEKTHVGLSLDFQQASYEGGEDYLELFTYVNSTMSENWSVMAYGYKGLDQGSPDIGLGLQISYRTN